MRILLVSIVDPRHSAHSRMHELAKHLSENNRVVLVSVRDAWKEKQNSSDSYAQDSASLLPDVEIHYLTKKRRNMAIQELLSKLYLRRLLPQIGVEFDLIVDYNTLLMGRNAASILRTVPRIYDLADDLVEMTRSSPQIPFPLNRLASLIGRRYLVRTLRNSTRLTCTTTGLATRYSVPAEKLAIVPNGVAEEMLQPLPSSRIIDSRTYSEEFLIGYVGVLREWIDFSPVFQAIVSLKHEHPLRLLIIGDEGGAGHLKELSSRMGISDRVVFCGTKPYVETRRYLAACDCGIIPFRKSVVSDMALPLKLFEYLSLGLPVISTTSRSIKEHFDEEVLFYEDSSSLESLLRNVIKDPSVAKAKARNGYMKVASRYSWPRIMSEFDEVIQETLKTKKDPDQTLTTRQ